MALSGQHYREPARRAAFYAEVLDRAANLPGVHAAALASAAPIGSSAPTQRIRIEPGAPAETPVAYRAVSPGYLRTVGIALRRGRFFTDRETEPVAVINEDMARRAWKSGEDSIGRRIEIAGKWRTVVGVMAGAASEGLLGRRVYETLVPIAHEPPSSAMLLVHTAAEPLTLQRPIDIAIHELDPELPLEFRTFEALHAEVYSPYRFIFGLFGSFAAVAVSLAAAGIYGVTSRSVAARSREIGIRMALGAARSRVVGDILRHGLWLALAGVIPGALLSLLLLKVLISKLWWVKASAPGVIVPVALLLTAIALAACWAPAHRATRVDPAATLRAE
jgi:predicted permease